MVNLRNHANIGVIEQIRTAPKFQLTDEVPVV
jgi:hypothetical protein